MTEQIEQPAETPAEAAQPAWAPEIEEEARALGWKSRDEWTGDIPPTYIDDPQRFVDRWSNTTPVKKLREQLASQQEAMKRIESATEKMFRLERERNAAELARVKAEKLEAVETADKDRYQALEKREAELMKEAPKDEDPHAKAAGEWVKSQDWWNKDKIKTAAAVVLHNEALASGITDPAKALKFVEDGLAERFSPKPEPKPEGGTVIGGLTLGGSADPFDKLPREAKEAFRRFVQKGTFKDTKEDRAQYVEFYNEAP